LQLQGAKAFATQKKKKKFPERERERESSPKQGYCTVMSRSNPPTNSSLEQMAES